MKLHYFEYSNRLVLIASEYCILCGKTSLILYEMLDHDTRKLWPHGDYSRKTNYRKLQIEFHNIYTPCENGLTEEEIMIKEIIE